MVNYSYSLSTHFGAFGSVKFQRTRISSIIKYINRVRLQHRSSTEAASYKRRRRGRRMRRRRRKQRVSRQTSIRTSTMKENETGRRLRAARTIIAGHEGGCRPSRRVESKTKSRKWKTKYRRRVVRSRRYPSLPVPPACPFPPGMTSPHRDAKGTLPSRRGDARMRASGIER